MVEKERRLHGRCGRAGGYVGIRPCGCPKLYWRPVCISRSCSRTYGGRLYAEKSADAVAARVASEERRACQHAPLWPMNVPILFMSTK